MFVLYLCVLTPFLRLLPSFALFLLYFVCGPHSLSCRYASSSWQETMKANDPRSRPLSSATAAERVVLFLRLVSQFLAITEIDPPWTHSLTFNQFRLSEGWSYKEGLRTRDHSLDGWLDSTPGTIWNVEQGAGVPTGTDRPFQATSSAHI